MFYFGAKHQALKSICVSELQLENAYPSISATLPSLTVDKLESP